MDRFPTRTPNSQQRPSANDRHLSFGASSSFPRFSRSQLSTDKLNTTHPLLTAGHAQVHSLEFPCVTHFETIVVAY